MCNFMYKKHITHGSDHIPPPWCCGSAHASQSKVLNLSQCCFRMAEEERDFLRAINQVSLHFYQSRPGLFLRWQLVLGIRRNGMFSWSHAVLWCARALCSTNSTTQMLYCLMLFADGRSLTKPG